MADIVKKLTGNAEAGSRYQIFTNVDAVSGDVLRVKKSLLGKSATHITVINGAAQLDLKFNVYHVVTPLRQPGEGFSDPWTGYKNISKSQEVMDANGSPTYSLAPNETLTLDNDFFVDDIMIVASAGTWKILVS